MSHKNLFASVLTFAAPSSNYRGESEENRTVIQKITKDLQEWAVVSPESMRNALREILAERLPPESINRSRIHDADQLAVRFKAIPDAATYADDFLFGFMVANAKESKGKPAKRDSVLRMNMAVATAPYRFEATFHQSPKNSDDSPFRNASSSALLHREVSYTAYQYPFALNLGDCAKGPRAWTQALLTAIGELSNVAGGHARSYYEMAPRSLVARLTPSLVAGFQTYGFAADGTFANLARISSNDLPGSEFWIGGEVVRQLPAAERERLVAQGAHLHENPQRLLAELTAAAVTW